MLDNWTRESFCQRVDEIGLDDFAQMYGRVCITDHSTMEAAYDKYVQSRAELNYLKMMWNMEVNNYAKHS